MAKRRLLTDEHWAGLLALPSDERDVVRHCTLSPDDLTMLAIKRTGHNRLGHALLLCAMRHPGRVLDVGEVPPASMVAYVARQIDTDPAALRSSPTRVQTRREHVAELMRHHGFGAFGRADAARFLSWLTPIAQLNRKPGELVAMLVEEVRRQRVVLPTPRVLELIVHHARTRGERITHRALTIDLTAVQSTALDGLLGSRGGPTRMAWLRQASSSPASRNLLGLIERMRTVRTLGIDRNRESAVPASAFNALAGEGLRMTAQHLRDLAQPRRAATMTAAVIRLETELTDAALLMFDNGGDVGRA